MQLREAEVQMIAHHLHGHAHHLPELVLPSPVCSAVLANRLREGAQQLHLTVSVVAQELLCHLLCGARRHLHCAVGNAVGRVSSVGHATTWRVATTATCSVGCASSVCSTASASSTASCRTWLAVSACVEPIPGPAIYVQRVFMLNTWKSLEKL
eukprot:2325386-Rhodomonas_salina.3